MSLDFAIIPADFDTPAQALQICDALYREPPADPPPAVAAVIDELDRIDAIGEQSGFLSLWPVDATASGVIVCTRFPRWDHSIYTLLEMTKDRGLALISLSESQVFDPRGRVDVEVETANSVRLPYLTEPILHDVLAREEFYGDHLVAARGDHHYVQAAYPAGYLASVEYRDGGPDRHYQTLTDDRAEVARLVWGWVLEGPESTTLRQRDWETLDFPVEP